MQPALKQLLSVILETDSTRLLYLKQGVEYQTILLADLYDTWIALSPGKRRSPRYLAQLKSLCEQFAKFAANREPPALEMTQVSVVLAEDFVASLERTGVAGKTRNEKLSRLNTLFKDLASRSRLASKRAPTTRSFTLVAWAATDSPVSSTTDHRSIAKASS